MTGDEPGMALFPAQNCYDFRTEGGERVRRRNFIGLIGAGLVAGRLAAVAQSRPPVRKRRIGFLTLDNADTQFFLGGLTDGLRELGLGEADLQLEVRSAQNATELLGLAAELIALKVELIFAFQTAAAIAARQAVHELPVVFIAADPVASGLVENLSRPGGNLTGVSAAVSELGAKNLEVIHELLPGLKRVAVLGNADDPFHPPFVAKIAAAAPPLGIEIEVMAQRSPTEIDPALADALERFRAEALLVHPGLAKQPIAELGLKLRLPAVSPNPSFVNVGGLASYSADFGEAPRRCAAMIVQVLKGNKPGDLPVELPSKFWLAFNQQTAKQLGITLSPAMTMRVDQFIE
jgi:putative ABC transport system substrate-binding protein